MRNDVPALRRSRLSWVNQNFIRNETLTAANACFVAAQNRIPLVHHGAAAKWLPLMASALWCRFERSIPDRTQNTLATSTESPITISSRINSPD